MDDKTMPTDEQIVAAVHKACGLGRVSLTHINNDGEEVPTDVAKCFARAIAALTPPSVAVNVQASEREAVATDEPEGYTDEWIAEQFRRTMMLVGKHETFVKALRVFGNRVLMQFGDREGMHRAFSEAYEHDKAERAALPAVQVPPGWRLVPIEPTPEWVTKFESIPEYQGVAEQTIREVLLAAPQGDAK